MNIPFFKNIFNIFKLYHTHLFINCAMRVTIQLSCSEAGFISYAYLQAESHVSISKSKYYCRNWTLFLILDVLLCTLVTLQLKFRSMMLHSLKLNLFQDTEIPLWCLLTHDINVLHNPSKYEGKEGFGCRHHFSSFPTFVYIQLTSWFR